MGANFSECCAREEQEFRPVVQRFKFTRERRFSENVLQQESQDVFIREQVIRSGSSVDETRYVSPTGVPLRRSPTVGYTSQDEVQIDNESSCGYTSLAELVERDRENSISGTQKKGSMQRTVSLKNSLDGLNSEREDHQMSKRESNLAVALRAGTANNSSSGRPKVQSKQLRKKKKSSRKKNRTKKRLSAETKEDVSGSPLICLYSLEDTNFQHAFEQYRNSHKTENTAPLICS
mmetsp:Transcript_4858/g.7349  ORF Transcript_4858/g.7349 Transcript_4858/m.7349 type:complete len:234 (+) Transcript_4858:246-947(+)